MNTFMRWPVLYGGLERLRVLWPGAAVAALVMVSATFMAEHHGGPLLLYALLMGLALNFLHEDGRCRPGIEFCTRTVLRAGVALLGARITLGQVGGLGLGPLCVAVAGIATTHWLGAWLAGRMGLTRDLGLLSGAAVSICGASAALAVSAVMPRSEENERSVLLTVVGVTGFSTLAMGFYPPLAMVLQLPDVAAGILLGGTIHDVAQVVGAASLISPAAADVAIIVKLLRVLLLVPVVALLALYWRGQTGAASEAAGRAPGRPPLVPLFLLVFMGLVLLNSAGGVPAAAGRLLGDLSRVCLVVAMAALGMKTSLARLVALGWRPVALMLAETLWLLALFVAYLWLAGARGQWAH